MNNPIFPPSIQTGLLTDDQRTMLKDAIEGLGRSPKTLQSKYFYDDAGSRIFDEITELPEYYPTRTEASIMAENADEIAATLGERVLLVEYGSGSSAKTRVLLDSVRDLAGYVPVDISGEYMKRVARDLRNDYPDVDVLPVVADFTLPFDVPKTTIPANRVVTYFPGSTIGNFQRDAARTILRQMASLAGPTGGMLIGVDLLKNRQTLLSAYNDSSGVTARFNLNILRHLNNELDADFRVAQFRHEAVFKEEHSRIEMHIFSLTDQVVCIDGHRFAFNAGESILTEYSHKYTPESFASLASEAGLAQKRVWTDSESLFSVQYLEPA